MIPCFLIPALVGLICGILGYLLGKMLSGKSNETDNALQFDLENCRKRNTQLQNDIDSLRTQQSNTASSMKFTDAPILIPFNADLAKSVLGKTVKENDLKIVEGIGPKIEELFNTSGILTWKALGETSVDRCQEILDKAGERFQVHNPSTWPRQAMLAYEGKWQELKDWQEKLDGGKE